MQDSEGRDANEQPSASSDRDNSEQRPSGRWISIVSPIIRALQRHSYLLALIAMLVIEKILPNQFSSNEF